MLSASNLVWRAGGRAIVDHVGLQVRCGEVLGIVGPNGCGKSTLLRLLCRVLRPAQGRVCLQGQDIWRLSARQFARRVAMLGQSMPTLEGTVHETVMMGRYPHQSRWSHDSAHDHAVVQACLQQVGATRLAQAALASLSGGERQRVLLARALTQAPELLLLDEPTNHLDIRYQLELMTLVRQLRHTVVVVLHDLGLAARFCDRIALMHAGRFIATGTPAQVLTPAHITQAFGVHADVAPAPEHGGLHIVYRL